MPSSTTGHELGDDRWRDFFFLALSLVVLAIVVWVIHVAIWGIEVRTIPMMRVGGIIGIYTALMVRARPMAYLSIAAASVLIGWTHSQLLLAWTGRCDCIWLNYAAGISLWCATAIVFAFAGSRLTRPPGKM